jgi:hypothetical protein
MVCEYFPTRVYLKSWVAPYITIITIIKTDGHPTVQEICFYLRKNTVRVQETTVHPVQGINQ